MLGQIGKCIIILHFAELCCGTACTVIHKSILLKHSLSTCGTVVKKENCTDGNIVMIRQVLELLQVN